MTTSRAQTLVARLPDPSATSSRPLLEPDDARRPARQLGSVSLTVTLVVANVVGALVVALLVTVVIPEPSVGFTGHVVRANAVAAALYIAVAVPIGYVWGFRHFRGLDAWLASGAPPTAREQRVVLRGPLHLLKVQAVLWLVAVALLAVLNATFSARSRATSRSPSPSAGRRRAPSPTC